MSVSEAPGRGRARLRYDNVFGTAWTGDVRFIGHSRGGVDLHFVSSAGLVFRSVMEVGDVTTVV